MFLSPNDVFVLQDPVLSAHCQENGDRTRGAPLAAFWSQHRSRSMRSYKLALQVGKLILNRRLKATYRLERQTGTTCLSTAQGCWTMTVSNHFLYARAKRLCSGSQSLSRIPLTKPCSEGRAGAPGGRAPRFSRLLLRGSGRDAPSTSIASPACLCPFTPSSPKPAGLCAQAFSGPSSPFSRRSGSLPPLLPRWHWCLCSLLQSCHR